MRAAVSPPRRSLTAPQELAHARQNEKDITDREAKLEQRISSMSKDLNAIMDELHAHDKAALEHQRAMRRQTKHHEDLMDATSQR